MQTPERQRLAGALRDAGDGLILVVTGAGISHPSGIPTFRGTDPDAVWRRSDIEMATFDYFRRDPAGQWSWYLQRFRSIDGARPNPAHHALRSLESWQEGRGGEFVLVTQNIDCLHEAAGSERLVKVHGSSDRVRCSADGCRLGAPHGSLARDRVALEPFLADPGAATVPRCPECGSLLRAHVLFFDEYYSAHADYRFQEVEAAADACTLALFVGTSFAVGVTELVLRGALTRGVTVASIDPGGQPVGLGLERVLRVPEPAETALPLLCEAVGASAS